MLRTTLHVLIWVSIPACSTMGQTLPAISSLEKGQTVKLDDVPEWLGKHRFRYNKFSFVRIKHGAPDHPGWAKDYPDADLNLAAQLGSMTKLDVSEPPVILELTNRKLLDHRFAYLASPEAIELTPAEVEGLRSFVTSGGLLLIDDFWGLDALNDLRRAMKKVFPNREPVELSIDHSIFQCVFRFKKKPQVISIADYQRVKEKKRTITEDVKYWAIVNENERVLVLMCHNTDLGDGWERLGEDETYEQEMSIRRAIPMGINCVFYALSENLRD